MGREKKITAIKMETKSVVITETKDKKKKKKKNKEEKKEQGAW